MSGKNDISNIPFKKSVTFMFVVYWAVLVIWQNINLSVSSGTIDLIIKCLLLAYFVFYYLNVLNKTNTLTTKLFIVILCSSSLFFTLITEPVLSLRIIVSYLYPVIFLFMIYAIGDKLEITQKNLLTFCNCIIVIVAYCAFYAMVFRFDRFVSAITSGQSYGHELTSIFISSHEYGLYLCAAIISVLLCLKLSKNLSNIKKLMYVLAMFIFAANLVLTFSRTSIFATIIFFAIFVFFSKGKLRFNIVSIAVITIVIIAIIPELREFIFKIVLKSNDTSGRDVLYYEAIQYYSQSSVYQKMFGYGITVPREYFEQTFDHGSIHNAYLQVLLYFGGIGLTAMILFILTQIWANIKIIKKNRFIGAVCLGLVLCGAAMMFTNTAILFTSPIDSYFLTIFMFIVPKYMRNAINKNAF